MTKRELERRVIRAARENAISHRAHLRLHGGCSACEESLLRLNKVLTALDAHERKRKRK